MYAAAPLLVYRTVAAVAFVSTIAALMFAVRSLPLPSGWLLAVKSVLVTGVINAVALE